MTSVSRRSRGKLKPRELAELLAEQQDAAIAARHDNPGHMRRDRSSRSAAEMHREQVRDQVGVRDQVQMPEGPPQPRAVPAHVAADELVSMTPFATAMAQSWIGQAPPQAPASAPRMTHTFIPRPAAVPWREQQPAYPQPPYISMHDARKHVAVVHLGSRPLNTPPPGPQAPTPTAAASLSGWFDKAVQSFKGVFAKKPGPTRKPPPQASGSAAHSQSGPDASALWVRSLPSGSASQGSEPSYRTVPVEWRGNHHVYTASALPAGHLSQVPPAGMQRRSSAGHTSALQKAPALLAAEPASAQPQAYRPAAPVPLHAAQLLPGQARQGESPAGPLQLRGPRAASQLVLAPAAPEAPDTAGARTDARSGPMTPRYAHTPHRSFHASSGSSVPESSSPSPSEITLASRVSPPSARPQSALAAIGGPEECTSSSTGASSSGKPDTPTRPGSPDHAPGPPSQVNPFDSLAVEQRADGFGLVSSGVQHGSVSQRQAEHSLHVRDPVFAHRIRSEERAAEVLHQLFAKRPRKRPGMRRWWARLTGRPATSLLSSSSLPDACVLHSRSSCGPDWGPLTAPPSATLHSPATGSAGSTPLRGDAVIVGSGSSAGDSFGFRKRVGLADADAHHYAGSNSNCPSASGTGSSAGGHAHSAHDTGGNSSGSALTSSSSVASGSATDELRRTGRRPPSRQTSGARAEEQPAGSGEWQDWLSATGVAAPEHSPELILGNGSPAQPAPAASSPTEQLAAAAQAASEVQPARGPRAPAAQLRAHGEPGITNPSLTAPVGPSAGDGAQDTLFSMAPTLAGLDVQVPADNGPRLAPIPEDPSITSGSEGSVTPHTPPHITQGSISSMTRSFGAAAPITAVSLVSSSSSSTVEIATVLPARVPALPRPAAAAGGCPGVLPSASAVFMAAAAAKRAAAPAATVAPATALTEAAAADAAPVAPPRPPPFPYRQLRVDVPREASDAAAAAAGYQDPPPTALPPLVQPAAQLSRAESCPGFDLSSDSVQSDCDSVATQPGSSPGLCDEDVNSSQVVQAPSVYNNQLFEAASESPKTAACGVGRTHEHTYNPVSGALQESASQAAQAGQRPSTNELPSPISQGSVYSAPCDVPAAGAARAPCPGGRACQGVTYARLSPRSAGQLSIGAQCRAAPQGVGIQGSSTQRSMGTQRSAAHHSIGSHTLAAGSLGYTTTHSAAEKPCKACGANPARDSPRVSSVPPIRRSPTQLRGLVGSAAGPASCMGQCSHTPGCRCGYAAPVWIPNGAPLTPSAPVSIGQPGAMDQAHLVQLLQGVSALQSHLLALLSHNGHHPQTMYGVPYLSPQAPASAYGMTSPAQTTMGSQPALESALLRLSDDIRSLTGALATQSPNTSYGHTRAAW